MAMKPRVLCLMQYLEQNSDEQHPVTTAEIRKELAAKGCPVSMYDGNEEEVTLRSRHKILDQVIDRFGEGIELKNVTQHTFDVTVPVCISGTFYAWVTQFVGEMTIIAPGNVKDAYAEYLQEAIDENLILHYITEEDLTEVARTWPADHHPLSDTEAREAIAYMRGNYGRNTKGCIFHLCMAVCRKDHRGTIMGWCGLDGTRNHSEPEIFILLDEAYRNKGYGTQCVKELLRIAAEDYALSGVHGGCSKENIASARAMEKGGMVQYRTEENGDPLFRFCAKNVSCREGNTCG